LGKNHFGQLRFVKAIKVGNLKNLHIFSTIVDLVNFPQQL